MNSLTKLIFSFSALIASLSFAWLALTATGMIHGRVIRVTMNHEGGDLDLSGSLELHSRGFDVWHDGSILLTH